MTGSTNPPSIASLRVHNNVIEAMGNTPLIKIQSLSKLTGCDIFIKAEHMCISGSIKGRAALQMVLDAEEAGHLKPGMTIVEGTAGNTGIGLAMVARAKGYKMLVVMPNNQAKEKELQVLLHGAELRTVDPVPFKNENHFFHTARRIAEQDPEKYWWANQFENDSNWRAHYLRTAPELFEQMEGKIDCMVSVAGTGGTIAGNSTYLKEKLPNVQVTLIDPAGSGLYSYFKTGEFKSEGSSITEGIGIMRLTSNMKKAKVDHVYTLPDQDVVTISRYVRDNDSIVLGSSAALNVCGALLMALKLGPGKRIVTFWCDGGDRAASKLYNDEFLKSVELNPEPEPIESLVERYKKIAQQEQ